MRRTCTVMLAYTLKAKWTAAEATSRDLASALPFTFRAYIAHEEVCEHVAVWETLAGWRRLRENEKSLRHKTLLEEKWLWSYGTLQRQSVRSCVAHGFNRTWFQKIYLTKQISITKTVDIMKLRYIQQFMIRARIIWNSRLILPLITFSCSRTIMLLYQ